MLSTARRVPRVAAYTRSFAASAQQGRSKKAGYDTCDGVTAVTHAAYGMSNTACIFPITPSSGMAELAEQWSNLGVKNALGDVCKVSQLQSEAGAAGAVHGAAVAGAQATTFTASQGLLLMIPNMYKISGELLPCVFHIAARALAGASLSIFGDHQDIMAARATGLAIFGGGNVQEAHDVALASHLATLKSRVPFIAFQDGFLVSHNIEKAQLLPYSTMRTLIDMDALNAHQKRALNPIHPHMRGTNQNPDVYMQTLESSNIYYDRVPGITKEVLSQMEAVTGRKIELISTYGPQDAEQVIVIMGSGAKVVEETIDYLKKTGKNEKVACVMVRMYRPWVADDFLAALPKNTKHITVLDRTKEPGSHGEPLFLDVAATLAAAGRADIKLTRGRYGLGQKEFTPASVLAILENQTSASKKDRFTVGIEDDVTHLSLTVPEEPALGKQGEVAAKIYGFGSDGTVGANKNGVKIIGDNTDLNVQAAFAYGSSKAGGLTLSHLRFSPDEIKSYYGVNQADYIACHNNVYVNMYHMVDDLKPGGTFVLNSPWTTIEELEKNLPGSLKLAIAQKDAKFYNVDAFSVAHSQGMGRMINTVMQSVFFKLGGVMDDYEVAIEMFKNAIKKTYGNKGEAVVKKNWEMVDAALDSLHQINYPKDKWLQEKRGVLTAASNFASESAPEFVRNVHGKIQLLQGDEIKVSGLPEGGIMPMGTAAYEKRGVALEVPEVNMDTCTQCNYCSMSCPHAVIRPFLLSQAEMDAAPTSLDARKAKGGADAAGLNFRIQVSAYDCTGCAVCVNTCPDDSLRMVPLPEAIETHKHPEHWDYLIKLPDRSDRFEKASVKGSQFHQPLLEFHGACAGCGETPYVKLATQMFGERMIIANATGCSSIWGGPYGSNPYTVRYKDGKGPAWGNSLFEDAAEYGYGMAVTTSVRRQSLRNKVNELLLDGADSPASPELFAQLDEWRNNFSNPKVCNKLADTLPPLLEAEKHKDPLLNIISTQSDLLPKLSMWTIGGDGWAFDIGYGGLDHVMASGHDINVMVLDTEVYSNTGGQTSKSTPIGAIAKFSAGGRETNKKSMAEIFMTYGNVYVANCSMGASMQQTMKAFAEADAWTGPSVVICYSPCIEHKNIDGMANTMAHMAEVAHSGYFPLWRYNPQLKHEGKNPFLLDTKKLTVDISSVLKNENRFAALKRLHPEKFEALSSQLREHVMDKYRHYQALAAGEADIGDDSSKEQLLILYGSETGTTQDLASRMADMCRSRNYAVRMMECDEMDVDELAQHKNVLLMAATCGEGDFPANCKGFWDQISKEGAYPEDHLSGVNFAVFGLGDSSYHQFNSVSKDFDAAMERLGGTRILEIGLGDDQHEDKFETAFDEWLPQYWQVKNAPAPKDDHLIPPPTFAVKEIDAEDIPSLPYSQVLPPGAQSLPVVFNNRETPDDYDRNVRHIRFDTKKSRGCDLPFLLGDVLNIFPQNDPKRVQAFLDFYGEDGSKLVRVRPQKQVDARREDAYRRPRSVTQIFTEVVDLLGRPNKYFYKALSRFATDEKEKKQLEFIASDEGKDEYSKLVNQTVTYDDVLRKFPSAHPPLEHLLSIIPCIKQRLYSIASSQRFDEDACDLMIVILNWTTPEGVVRTGLCTDYVQRISGGDSVAALITSGTFNFPKDPMTPQLMAGLGTGLAPFRAFIQERAWMNKQGIQTGPMWMFYGCRYKAKEWDNVFGRELEQFNKDGVLTHMRPAFSRDQKEKIYVQNRIEEGGQEVYDHLVTKGGYFYICGQAGETETAIIRAVKKCYQTGGMTEQQADAEWEKVKEEGRYCPELY